MNKRYVSTLGWIVLLTGVYVCAGKLGLGLAALNPSASPVWLPTGLALAAMLLLGYRIWPAVFVGAFIVNVTTAKAVPTTFATLAITSLLIAVGNTLEAVLGGMLTRRFAAATDAFETAPDIVRFVFFAAIPSTALCATIGVTTLAVPGLLVWSDYAPVWLTWWTGNLVSDLVVAPLLIIWISKPLAKYDVAAVLEAAILSLLLITVGLLVFGPWNTFGGRAYPLSYLAVPVLVWAAFRFRQHGAIAASALISVLAIVRTIQGYGPFASGLQNDALLLLQAFLGINTLTILVLAAVTSERSNVSSSLEQYQTRLQMALESGKMGTWEWDIASGRVAWSPGLERIHRLAPGSFPGTFQAFLDDVHPDDHAMVRQRVARAMEDRADHHLEYRLRDSGESPRWVEARGRLICDAAGNPQRMIGVCIDVTERKAAMQEREQLLQRERQARSEAEHANRAKDEFLAVLSHELRTPLTPVMLTVSMLENDPGISPQVRDDLKNIRRNVELEARLIDDLLDLTRITRRTLQLELQTTDLHQVISCAIDICCRDERLNLELCLDAENHFVQADPGRMQQVFWNLLNNACKFTPEGGAIRIASRNIAGGRIIVEIADTGVGIKPELLPRLFDAFERGDMVSARHGGLGLGLAISRALVRAHGGTLTGHSPGPGRGSTFTVQMSAAATPQPRPEGSNGHPPTQAPTRALRILLVEDHESTLRAMQRLLSARQHQVTAATSVADALAAADREPFDLLISDLGLPDGLGYDIMRAVAAKYHIRGIALSGYGMAADIEQSRKAGFVEHLTKPVDIGMLEAAISRVVADVPTNEI